MQGDNKATLIIGDQRLSVPDPLLRSAGEWSFDTRAGRLEILARRIGRNELDTIQTALAYVDAKTNTHPRIARAKVPGLRARRLDK